MTQTKVDIILVHGTFAQNADWCKEESLFRVALTDYLRLSTKYHVFEWSGQNSHVERFQAARQLRNLVSSIYQEGSNLFIVAHSHGGNLVCYGEDYQNLFNKVSGVIFLGTPFITLRARDFDKMSVNWTLGVLEGLCLLFSLGLMFYIYIGSQMGIFPSRSYAYALLPIIIFGAGDFIRVAVAEYMGKAMDESLQHCKVYTRPILNEKKCFIATSQFDEAFLHLKVWLTIINVLSFLLFMVFVKPLGLLAIGAVSGGIVMSIWNDAPLIIVFFMTAGLVVISLPIVVMVIFLIWAAIRALSRNKYIFGNDKFSNLAFQKVVLMRYPNGKLPKRHFEIQLQGIAKGLHHSAYYNNRDLIRRIAMFVRSSLEQTL